MIPICNSAVTNLCWVTVSVTSILFLLTVIQTYHANQPADKRMNGWYNRLNSDLQR